MKPRKVSMFGIVNWASTRENLVGGGGVANIKVQVKKPYYMAPQLGLYCLKYQLMLTQTS